jgi:transposase-like protein
MTTESEDLPFDMDAVKAAFKNVKHMNDLTKDGGPFQLMFKSTLERLMKAELEDHLGYSHGDVRNKKTENCRNGTYKKTVKSTAGKVEIEVPRDREGSYEPIIVPKFESQTSDLEAQIISLYAKGMTTRDISEHLKGAYLGVEISPTLISNVTEKILSEVTQWQSRPLDALYPVIFFDAIHYKVRDDHKIYSKAAYVCLGISKSGHKDVLGIYIGENESSTFWLSVLTDLKTRGIQDILIASIDGLKGFPEAIKTIFPKTEVQTCIVHQIRNSLRYVGSKYQKEFMRDLKPIYQATTIELAEQNLKKLEDKWGERYPVVTNSWKKNWPQLSQYFKYSPPIRKMIYTTNIVEGFHRQLRKVTKNRSVFPSDKALLKLMYLATMDASKKWTMVKRDWSEIIGQLSIHFEDRIKLEI